MNFFKTLLINIFTMTLFISNLSGQTFTVSGKVTNKITNLPIDSAMIEFINKSNMFDRDTIFTDAFGNFTHNITLSNVSGEILPENISLSQNYPNPFNPSTKIDFTIPQPGEVKIFVYDILGKEIDSRTFYLNAGSYTIDWFSKGSAGVYIYAIEHQNIRISKKMIQLDGSKNGGLGNIYFQTGKYQSGSFLKILSNDYKIIASKFSYESDTVDVTIAGNLTLNFSIETVHNKAFVIDLHNDVLEKVVYGYDLGSYHTFNHSDIPRFREGGVDAQMMSLWVDPSRYPSTAYQQTLAMIDSFQSQLNQNTSTIAQAKNSREIDSLHKIGKFTAILVVEGGHSIENNIEKLKALYTKGVRYMTITWNNSTSWATAAADPQSATKGLSDFGRQVIKSMDSLGIIIDVSHVGKKTIEDILTVTTNPIIASHSGVRTLRNHYRNLTDEQIISIANTGGVIGIVFYPPFLSSASSATIDTVIKHIDYIKNLVGIDHIALGSDFDGIERTVIGLEDVSKFPNLTLALLKRGYTNAEIRKILGENFMRVFRRVCK